MNNVDGFLKTSLNLEKFPDNSTAKEMVISWKRNEGNRGTNGRKE